MSQEQNQKIKDIISSTPDVAQQIDKVAELRRWFRPRDNNSFYSVVQEYLAKTTDLEEATNKLCAPIDEAISANRLDDIDWTELWYAIIHSAKRISFRDTETHSKLVALMNALKERPDSSKESDQPVYSSLPAFGMASRESYNDGPGVAAGFTTPEIQAWANMNYFFALLTASDVYDISLFCIWAMRSALENVLKDGDPEEFHRKPATAVQKYEALVPAAAVWVFAWGKGLYEMEKDLTPTESNQGNPAKGGDLWTGKAEFSKERWGLWKKRFGEIKEIEGVKKETKEVAKEAVEAMENAEGS